MKRQFLCWKAALIAFFLLAVGLGIVLGSSDGIRVPHTGDFGEYTCRECHDTYPLNLTGGTITVTGIPTQYALGDTYRLTVQVSRSGSSRWGFQVTSRIATGVDEGRQAGVFTSIDTKTQAYQWSSGYYLGAQVIEQTTLGSLAGQTEGVWSFDWTAPTSDVGEIRFSAVGLAANNDASWTGDYVYSTTITSRYSPTSALPISALFAHMAIGGGYKTTFLLQNTGTTPLNGNLILTRNDGAALNARLVTGSIDNIGSSVPASIPPGGIQVITASAPNTSDPTSSGWARVESAGGVLSGVATFQYEPAGKLQAAAGVLAADTTEFATIPLDDDDAAARYTGYAVANTSGEQITVRAVLVPESGVSGSRITLTPITLAARTQKAVFVIQDSSTPRRFRGSLVLMGQDARKFAVVALVQNQGLLTAIPVVPAKASGID